MAIGRVTVTSNRLRHALASAIRRSIAVESLHQSTSVDHDRQGVMAPSENGAVAALSMDVPFADR
jgi:hypothetical protein